MTVFFACTRFSPVLQISSFFHWSISTKFLSGVIPSGFFPKWQTVTPEYCQDFSYWPIFHCPKLPGSPKVANNLPAKEKQHFPGFFFFEKCSPRKVVFFLGAMMWVGRSAPLPPLVGGLGRGEGQRSVAPDWRVGHTPPPARRAVPCDPALRPPGRRRRPPSSPCWASRCCTGRRRSSSPPSSPSSPRSWAQARGTGAEVRNVGNDNSCIC